VYKLLYTVTQKYVYLKTEKDAGVRGTVKLWDLQQSSLLSQSLHILYIHLLNRGWLLSG